MLQRSQKKLYKLNIVPLRGILYFLEVNMKYIDVLEIYIVKNMGGVNLGIL